MISKDRLIDILTDYFAINGVQGSYTYVLQRTKTAFHVGTMTLDDFKEFTYDDIEDIAEYVVGKYGDEL